VAALSIEDVVRGTQGALVAGDLGVPVSGVSIDSRHLAIGEAFFAIQGPNRDGHGFLRDAAARGAACLVVHNLPDDLPPSVPTILVDDTTRALGRLAAYHRARFQVPVAAVTGSNGKTTTKEMMAAVLEALGPVLKPEGSFNNQWGLPLTLLRLGPEHKALALELGANTAGEIASLAAISRPTVGAVTVVSSAHLEFFGSLDGVAAEKSALVRAIPPDGAVVLNADDPRVLAMHRESRARVLYVSTRSGADVFAEGPVEDDGDGLRFTLAAGTARRPVRHDRSHRHHRADADDDAEDGQGGSHLARAQRGERDGNVLLDRVDEVHLDRLRNLECARPAKCCINPPATM
jgi:UDP-N-acetylmuramyl pentapeptide synthase